MRPSREEAACSTEPVNNSARRSEPVLDLISAVKGLHGLSSQELGKLIREAENNIIGFTTETGLCVQIDVEKLARYLASHLIAVIMAWERDEALFKYLLSGFRILHSLCDLVPRHPKIEQLLLDDVKVSEQLIDLIIYLLTVLAACRQEHHLSNHMAHLHSALVPASLYLLMGAISSQFPEVTQVLLAYYKVDVFVDAAFAAVRMDIKFLQTCLLAGNADFCTNSSLTAVETLHHLCQQCEASLQFLQSLCQQKLFRECLVKNKELCCKGGVLLLALAVLKLNISPFFVDSSAVVAAVSRMKSKVLLILLHLSEAESVSYLDEVASNPGSLRLAKTIAFEVLELLKKMFGGDPKLQIACSTKIYPNGQLQLNAMRLTDIFSDDSNFRSYITKYFTEVLAAIFSLPHGEFLSSWCSSELPLWEEDTTLEYDACAAAGRALDMFSSSDTLNPTYLEPTFVPGNVPRVSYAHQRTSLLVKVMANLHCFVPDIIKEEKDLFLNKFRECLEKDLPKLSGGSATSISEKAVIVYGNLSSLLSHAESLIPGFVNEEDVQLLRVFITQLESLIKPVHLEENLVQEAQTKMGCSSPTSEKVDLILDNRSDILKEELKTTGFHEVYLSNFRSSGTGQSTDMGKKGRRTDKCKHSSGAARDTSEIEIGTQNVETSGSDSSSPQGKNPTDHMVDIEPVKSIGIQEVQGNEKVDPVQYGEAHQRKRKRTIMNDKQIAIIEKALVDEPDMHRNAASLLIWADKLSMHGSEVTSARLKNWLNNRKARLARGAKDGRVLSESDNPDRQGGSGSQPSYELPNTYAPSTARGNQPSETGDAIACSNVNSGMPITTPNDAARSESVNIEKYHYVMIVDENGKEIGIGIVFQVHGSWYGKNLRESRTTVVDIVQLWVERSAKLPYPSESTGTSFDQAKKIHGQMRVLWDTDKLSR